MSEAEKWWGSLKQIKPLEEEDLMRIIIGYLKFKYLNYKLHIKFIYICVCGCIYIHIYISTSIR